MKESVDEKKIKQYIAERQEEFKKQLDKEEAWSSIIHRIRTRRIRRWSAYAACAVVFLLVSVSIYEYGGASLSEPMDEGQLAANFPEMNENKAFLVLGDGNRVRLDSCRKITDKEAFVATNDNKGMLSYQATDAETEAPATPNTLVVPRGGSYRLCLSDGTKVWLNAESSLTYPAAFAKAGAREVRLTGEAYFEVAQDNDRPFIVYTDKQRVTVMGTKFNVAAYPEIVTRTTLAEGKVAVRSLRKAEELLLLPNQQAVLTTEDELSKKEVDAAACISWIDGMYEFTHVSLLDIVSQLSRWYDVDIRFADKQLENRYFTGAISRKYELGFAIDIIQTVSDVVFERDGNTIVVNTK